MTVAELIEILKSKPQDIQVVYQCYSEMSLMRPEDICIAEASEPRPDGWVHDKRPDKPTRLYLAFPGN